MSLSVTAGNTMDTAHFHLYVHTLVQVARGRWKGGVPFSIALSLVTMETRLWLETTGERNHGVCFTTSSELCFCHWL